MQQRKEFAEAQVGGMSFLAGAAIVGLLNPPFTSTMRVSHAFLQKSLAKQFGDSRLL